MKRYVIGASILLVLSGFSQQAAAYDGILECWFDENGKSQGADSGNGAVGSLERRRESGDYTYGFFIAPNTDCPTSINPPNPAPMIGTVIPNAGGINF